MNVLSLFAGIGGLDLGLERAGMTVVGQVEIDDFCRRVLAKHWPEVPRHDDVRTCVEWWRGLGGRPVDVLAGGPPCQPASSAGAKRAQQDERWLWPAFAYAVRELRPRWVLLEDVPGLFRRGFGDVLGDLAACGYDAEWDCVPASALGAPHLRERVFVVAHAQGDGLVDGDGLHEGAPVEAQSARVYVAQPEDCGWWAVEPAVGRVVRGLPGRVDRVRALGNAVVPQVAEYIGRLILAAAGSVAA